MDLSPISPAQPLAPSIAGGVAPAEGRLADLLDQLLREGSQAEIAPEGPSTEVGPRLRGDPGVSPLWGAEVEGLQVPRSLAAAYVPRVGDRPRMDMEV
jgi:hypothetical protein